ncbi:MAG: glycosyltransferase family 2 protein [Ignavibacterium sp.]
MNSSERKIKVAAVIPFFNEENFIIDVVSRTLNYVDLVIAVNDGSTDNSAALLKNFENLILVSNEKNFGKGFALQKGFEKAVSLKAEIIITLDADDQHKPEMIPDFIEGIKDCDLVIGNRLHDISTMPLHRRFSNWITSFFLSKKLGIDIKDSQCGFRAYRREVLEKVRTIFSGFEAESEMIVKAARNNFKIKFIDIPTIYGNQKSKMKSFQAIKGFIKVLMI